MPDLSTLKVLVVDDELGIRKIIKSMLNAIGITEITEAADGQEAFNLLKMPRTPAGGGSITPPHSS